MSHTLVPSWLPRRTLSSLLVAGISAGMLVVGASPASAAAPTAGQTVSLRSVNFPSQYVRHLNYEGRLTDAYDQDDRFEASFHVVRGLANSNAVSFESVTHPGHFLRHDGFAIKLAPRTDSALFRADATFWMRTGLSGKAATYSAESYNFPGYYIRHMGKYLHVHEAAKVNGSFAADASFFSEPGAWRWDPSVAPAAQDSTIRPLSTSTTMTARWTDRDPSETGFLVAHGPDRDRLYSTTYVSWAGGTGTTLPQDFTGLPNESWYCVKVATLRNGMPAGWSATKCRSTSPQAPANVVAAEHDTYVTLTWSDRSRMEAAFRIERSVNGGAYTRLSQVAANLTGYVDTAVEPYSTYRYRVVAVTSSGDVSVPGYSNSVKVAPAPTSGTVSLRLYANYNGTSYAGTIGDYTLQQAGVPADATVAEISQPGCGNTGDGSILLNHSNKEAWLAPKTPGTTWAGTAVGGAYYAVVRWENTFPSSCYVTVTWKTTG